MKSTVPSSIQKLRLLSLDPEDGVCYKKVVWNVGTLLTIMAYHYTEWKCKSKYASILKFTDAESSPHIDRNPLGGYYRGDGSGSTGSVE